VADAYAGTGKFNTDLKMADPTLTKVPLDLNDNYKTTILSMFPTLILAQVDNTYLGFEWTPLRKPTTNY
jgi:anthranilate 1,2-dioxygenase large subunit